jgi:hypothetical protein
LGLKIFCVNFFTVYRSGRDPIQAHAFPSTPQVSIAVVPLAESRVPRNNSKEFAARQLPPNSKKAIATICQEFAFAHPVIVAVPTGSVCLYYVSLIGW